MHSTKQIKTCKYNRDEKLTLDVFRPQLGSAVNPFALSFHHEPPVFVRTPRDGQRTPPLYCFTHKDREEDYDVLAPDEHYTYALGVFGFGKIRTKMFFNDMPKY